MRSVICIALLFGLLGCAESPSGGFSDVAEVGTLDAGGMLDASPDDANRSDAGDVDASVVSLCSEPAVSPSEPWIPAWDVFPVAARIRVLTERPALLRWGWSAVDASEPTSWSSSAEILLPDGLGPHALWICDVDDCASVLPRTINVANEFSGSASEDDHEAVTVSELGDAFWASRVVETAFGDALSAGFMDATKALGAAEGDNTSVVSLGRGGHIVLAFEHALRDGAGSDLVVFENSFSDTFLELGRVSISSDCETFVAFPVANLSLAAVGPFGSVSAKNVHGFAGKYRAGFGVAFDFAELASHPARLNLEHIECVRIDDVVGDGRERDVFDGAIYDPYPTSGSAGFDLDGVAGLHAAECRLP